MNRSTITHTLLRRSDQTQIDVQIEDTPANRDLLDRRIKLAQTTCEVLWDAADPKYWPVRS